jgi:hypothetical protein
MLRNKQSPIVQATAIVDCIVTGCIKRFYEDNILVNTDREVTTSMKNIHIFLFKNLDLLSKRFIFFPFNEGSYHWNGWAAVNPWVQLAQVLYERVRGSDKANKRAYKDLQGYRHFANGLISCDGLDTKGVKDTRCVIWFLNLASAYCDMAIDQKLDWNFYLSHTPRSYYMLGCSGPFGMLDVRGDRNITYKILTLHKAVKPVQLIETDSFNCGLIWCLFVYDMMLQVTNCYHDILVDGSRELPLSLGIGKTWLHPQVFDVLVNKKRDCQPSFAETHHYKKMCNNLWEELVCLLEKLRLLRLQSFSTAIEVPDKWGCFHSVFKTRELTELRKTIMTFPGKTQVQINLKEETKI